MPVLTKLIKSIDADSSKRSKNYIFCILKLLKCSIKFIFLSYKDKYKYPCSLAPISRELSRPISKMRNLNECNKSRGYRTAYSYLDVEKGICIVK